MLRFALIGFAALGLMATAVSGQGKMDCHGLYKSAVEKFHKEKVAQLTGDRIAEANRIALRAYDACSAGDEVNARTFFDQLDRWSS